MLTSCSPFAGNSLLQDQTTIQAPGSDLEEKRQLRGLFHLAIGLFRRYVRHRPGRQYKPAVLRLQLMKIIEILCVQEANLCNKGRSNAAWTRLQIQIQWFNISENRIQLKDDEEGNFTSKEHLIGLCLPLLVVSFNFTSWCNTSIMFYHLHDLVCSLKKTILILKHISRYTSLVRFANEVSLVRSLITRTCIG